MKIVQFKKLRPRKTWIIFGVALSVGLLAALAARSYLNSRMEAIDAMAKGKLVNVVVAKRDLTKGTRLTSETVAVRGIPAELSQSLAITPEAFDRIDGEALAYPVKAGEMILWGLIEGKKVATFSSRVENGHRAMTVPVDEINSISGLLEPGDIIDLVATLEKKGKRVTFPLLQTVQVMATGQRSIDDPKSGTRRQYSTVTLDISPEEARNVIVAREAGKITALLRNPQDKQSLAKPRDVAALLGLKGDQDGEVPVLYGGRGTKPGPDGLNLKQSNSAFGFEAAPEQAPRAPATSSASNFPSSPLAKNSQSYPP